MKDDMVTGVPEHDDDLTCGCGMIVEVPRPAGVASRSGRLARCVLVTVSGVSLFLLVGAPLSVCLLGGLAGLVVGSAPTRREALWHRRQRELRAEIRAGERPLTGR